jgi:hypothetical protein
MRADVPSTVWMTGKGCKTGYRIVVRLEENGIAIDTSVACPAFCFNDCLLVATEQANVLRVQNALEVLLRACEQSPRVAPPDARDESVKPASSTVPPPAPPDDDRPRAPVLPAGL